MTARAPLRAATCATTDAFDHGSARMRRTPPSRILVVRAPSDCGDGGTPGLGSIAATTTRPKRRAKEGQQSRAPTTRSPAIGDGPTAHRAAPHAMRLEEAPPAAG